MAKCGICHKYMKPGTINKHHYWFPKAKFVGTSEGRITTPLHYLCHKDFHYHYLHYCTGTYKPCVKWKKCEACEYLDICCYAVAHME